MSMFKGENGFVRSATEKVADKREKASTSRERARL